MFAKTKLWLRSVIARLSAWWEDCCRHSPDYEAYRTYSDACTRLENLRDRGAPAEEIVAAENAKESAFWRYHDMIQPQEPPL